MKIKLVVFVAGLSFVFAAHGQNPVANFTIVPSTGCLDNGAFAVNCANLSSNAISSSFDYDDGSAPSSSPNHIYTKSGVFIITLTVTGVGGATSTATQTVTILAPPVVAFTANPTTGCFPFITQFTDNSTSAAGTITNWSWDFGDGNISNLQNPSHVYRTTGTFPVSLTVTNNNGCIASLQKPAFIQITSGLTAGFSSAVSSGCNPPISVTFTNLSSGNAANINYSWNFGDGSPILNQPNPSPGPTHNYNSTGGFPVTLIASSSSGCTDTFTNIVHVNGGSSVSDFSEPDSVCVGMPVNFVNRTTPSATTTNWDFGDGNTSNQINPTHTFLTGGTFNVQLKNTFGPCSDLVIKPIVVLTKPVPSFTVMNALGCTPPLTVSFTNTSVNGVYWFWDFGDSTTSTQQNPSHTYTSYGVRNVKLVASNAAGCIDSITINQVVQVVQPVVKVTNLPAFGCIPYSYTPITSIVAVDGVASYAWDFGDGTTSTQPNPPAHVYSVAGKYPVKLVVTTNGGCTASYIDTVKVGSVKPVANFSFTPNPSCVYSSVQFTDMSSGVPPPNQWFWDFGNGNTSGQENPNVPFNGVGTFKVVLTAYIDGCLDMISKMITISPPAPSFTFSINCINKNQIVITNTTVGATTWLWNFGDGKTFNGQNPPAHNYAALGTYNLSLTSSDNGNCVNTLNKTVRIINEIASFSASASTVCKNSPVTFTSSNNSANVASFKWNFGDTIISGSSATIVHSFRKAGNYTVTLTITDLNGCTDSLKTPIQVNGPTANFSASAVNGCKGLLVNFNDLSTTDGTHAITSWTWDYGDGTVQTYPGPPFNHVYLTQGNFTVNLKVLDASGCTDSLSQVNLVNIFAPAAQFFAQDSMSCPGATIQFTNTSLGYGLTYTWDFGDASANSTLQDPAHAYAAVGTYPVLLKVVDQYGCRDSIQKNMLVDTPFAAFTMSDSTAKCPPLQINFTFTGRYYKSLKWIFSDGASSILVNPVHIYTIPGTYIDSLIVTSPGGCTSIATDTVKILGPYGVFSYAPLTGCNPLTVNFNVNTSGVVQYTWDFNDGQTQTTPGPSVSYTYTKVGNYLPLVILQDASTPPCNVPVLGTDTIRVIGSVPGFGVDKNLLCGSGTIQFSDSTTSNGAITGYAWDFGDGNTDVVQNPAHFYAAPGQYTVKLTVTTQGTCLNTITKTALIKVVAIPSVDINGTVSQCVPATLNFQGVLLVPDTSVLNWHWNFYNGKSSGIQNPAAQLYITPGQDSVQLIVINSSGCADTVSKNFTVYPLPPTDAGPDTTICLGQSTILTATGATTYNWLPPNNTLSCTNCAGPTATPVVTTSYVVSGVSNFGCVKNDIVVVTVIQPQTISIVPVADSICIGQSIPLQASGESIFTWTPAAGLSDPTIANPVASPDTTTIYQVVGSDSQFCFSDTQFVKISVFNYPTINLGPDVTIPVGSSYQINGIGSSDITDITWTPVTALSCTNCLTPLASPINSTTYIAKVVNEGGCAATDSITIIVVCNNGNLFVPNTFSPNGDGMNDVFYVRGKGLTTIQSMRIFDRWGQLVFEKRNFAPNDPASGWDGTMNGRKAPIDVYIYTIEVICENSVIVPYHGNVALIR